MTEQQGQQAVIKWGQQPHIRIKYPELKLMYHTPNERCCTPARGKQLKLAGVRKGVPDLHLPVARGEYHSLYIEMKTETGRTSPEQNWWGDELRKEGNYVAVCHGFAPAIRVLEWYLNLKGENNEKTN